MDTSPEFADVFQELDGMINAFDAEGAGPLRKGEQAFSWAVVEKLALPLAQEAPDLRVGLWLLRAGLANQGVSGLASGLARLAAWLQLPAETVHPLPEAGEHPRDLHGLLLAWITTPAFLRAVQDARLGAELPLTLRRLIEGKELPGAPTAGALQAVRGALVDSIANLQILDQVLVGEVATRDVSLASVLDFLSQALGRLDAWAAPSGVEAGTRPSQASPPHVAQRPLDPPAGGPVEQRQQARVTLEELIRYFQVHEPGHPAPIFLQRVQRMLGASFEGLLQELYLDADQLLSKLERPAPN